MKTGCAHGFIASYVAMNCQLRLKSYEKRSIAVYYRFHDHLLYLRSLNIVSHFRLVRNIHVASYNI